MAEKEKPPTGVGDVYIAGNLNKTAVETIRCSAHSQTDIARVRVVSLILTLIVLASALVSILAKA